jgi:hypothetical protein
MPRRNQIAVSEPFDVSAVDLGNYSTDLDGDHLSPIDVRYALHAGSLHSFYLMTDEVRTVCSFVATWDAPLKSEWVVDVPRLTPDENRVDPDPCSNGWSGHIAECQARASADFEEP